MAATNPVKSRSGAGFMFEDYFGAYLAIAVLARKPVIGHDLGPPVSVDFQVDVDGWKLDDALVSFNGKRGEARWAVSVKSNQQINRTASSSFVKAAWQELRGETGSGFDPDQDLLGLVTSPMQDGTRADLEEIIRLAVDQDPSVLDRRIAAPGYVSEARQRLWKSFAPPERQTGSARVSDSPGEVLKRFKYIEAAFPPAGSPLEETALGWCTELVRDPDKSHTLWNSMLVEIARIRTAGGYMDRAKLIDRLYRRYSIRIDTGPNSRLAHVRRLRRASRARLIERWLAVGVPEQTAEDLADDSSVGKFPDEISQTGVVTLVGDFGAGKSVTAERLHADDLDTYLDGKDHPVPVFLRARAIRGTLEQSVYADVPPSTDIDARGVRLILDGLDEAGASRGAELLAEARVLVRAVQDTRVLVTMRPGFEVTDEEKIVAPRLSDEILMDLAERLTGHKYSLSGLEGPVKDAVRYPLFAIIALQQRARARELPSSRALFLETLVKKALGGARDEAMSSLDVLAAAANLSITSRGSFPEKSLGPPDTVSRLLATRLVVRDQNSLRFALPVLEQYFGAYALLREHVDVDRIVSDLATFEMWRHAFVVAVGVGTWADTSRILEQLGDAWPGAACWVISQAVSEHAVPGGPGGPLLNSHECAQRLRRALKTWASWLQEIIPLTHLMEEDGDLVTVEAAISDGRLAADLVSSNAGKDNSKAIASRWGIPPSDEEGWPWRWAMDWMESGIKRLLAVRCLPLPPDGALRAEREWFLARRLVGDRSVLHPPIDPQRIIGAGQPLLTDPMPDPRSQILFDDLPTPFGYSEVADIVAKARAHPDKPFVRPWPRPDKQPPGGRWRISDLYSTEQMHKLIETVYLTAMVAYNELSRTWFPKWVPTLGWGAAMPIHLDLALNQTAGLNESPWLFQSEIVADPPAGVGVTVTIREDDPLVTVWPDRDRITLEYNRLLGLRPNTAKWAKLFWSQGVFDAYGDTPATDLAYTWLWRDLRQIGLLESPPPHGLF